MGIIATIVLFISLYLRSIEIKKIDSQRQDISRLLEINDNIDKLSYVDIYVTPAIIAEYPSDSNAFYVVYNNNYYSILYMNKKEASKINKTMVENGYRIYGITKEKPNGIEKYGLNFLEKLFETHNDSDGHNHNLDENSYDEYFGTIYIDATVSKYNETKIYNIIICILGIMFFFLLMIPISKIIICKK